MASLRKKPNSKFWIACFTDQNGEQRQRSTRTADKAQAMRAAFAFEDAYRLRMTEHQIRRVMNDACESVNGRGFATATASEFFARWLARKKAETTEGTLTRYSESVARFEKYLGPERWSQEMSRLSASDFARFRDHAAKTVSPATANLVLKILSGALKSAWIEGVVPENFVAKVERLKLSKRNSNKRRPFTLAELRLLLEHANAEWKGIILCAVYTGQRLGDIVRLVWRNVDLERQEVRLETQKTGRTVIVPMAKPLLNYFLSVPSVDDPTAPLFPQAFATVLREGRVNNLSNQFYEIMVAAGLASERSTAKQKEGDGRDVRRQQRELVFHSLRHTATSLLKNAGVSEAVAMDIIGHDSPAISQNYTHVDDDAKRRAIARMPDILSVKKRAGGELKKRG